MSIQQYMYLLIKDENRLCKAVCFRNMAASEKKEVVCYVTIYVTSRRQVLPPNGPLGHYNAHFP